MSWHVWVPARGITCGLCSFSTHHLWSEKAIVEGKGVGWPSQDGALVCFWKLEQKFWMKPKPADGQALQGGGGQAQGFPGEVDPTPDLYPGNKHALDGGQCRQPCCLLSLDRGLAAIQGRGQEAPQ